MAKYIAMIIALGVIVACSIGLSSYFELDKKTQDLKAAQKALEENKNELATKIEVRDSVQARLQKTKEQVESYTKLAKTKQELTDKILELESERRAVQASFASSVQSQRAAVSGSAWSDLNMPSGQVYTQVTIQKLTDTEVTIAHAGGVAKVRLHDMPADFKHRLRFDQFPPGPAASGPSKLSTTIPTVATPTKGDEKIAAIRSANEKITELVTRINSLQSSQAQWQTSANGHRQLAETARANGRPTYNHVASAKAADQQVGILTAQIKKLQEELIVLQSKLR